jgi:hypothetical protein
LQYNSLNAEVIQSCDGYMNNPIMKRTLRVAVKNLFVVVTGVFFVLLIHFSTRPDNTFLTAAAEYGVYDDTIRSDSTAGFYKEEVIDSIIEFGKTFLGLRYRYGGRTPEGFDCSGYVSYLFGSFGYRLPVSSPGMGGVGEEIPYESARKGDLILFKGRNIQSPTIGHVAIIIDVDSLGVVMLHSNRRGVTIDRYPQMEYYGARYLGVRRVPL